MSLTAQGFTLIELMIVLALIGILTAIALPQYQNFVARSQIATTHYELSGLRPGAEHYMLNNPDEPELNNLDAPGAETGDDTITTLHATLSIAEWSADTGEATLRAVIDQQVAPPSRAPSSNIHAATKAPGPAPSTPPPHTRMGSSRCFYSTPP